MFLEYLTEARDFGVDHTIIICSCAFRENKSPLNLLSELQVQIICLIHRTNDVHVCEIFPCGQLY
jgi:hypothetical protein